MILNASKQRLYASLLTLGAGILFYRTIRMITQGSMGILVPWVSALLILEAMIDAAYIVASLRWWFVDDESKDTLPLRFGAAAALLHAFRVLIFVLGRVGPWIDFDVRIEHRALHATRLTWGWVVLAAVMSVLGVIGVIIIWRIRRKMKKEKEGA